MNRGDLVTPIRDDEVITWSNDPDVLEVNPGIVMIFLGTSDGHMRFRQSDGSILLKAYQRDFVFVRGTIVTQMRMEDRDLEGGPEAWLRLVSPI